MREMYDVVTKQHIQVGHGQRGIIALQLNIPPTAISHLWSGKTLYISSRYILPQNKDKIFTLVDLDTKQEYDCIANSTIFLYFNLPYNENEIKYIDRMKRGKQHIGSICGRVLYLKENGEPKIMRSNIKNASQRVIEQKYQFKLRRKIYNKLLSRIYSSLKSIDLIKKNSTEETIGCKILFFIGYIESKFTKGMSWDNYGEWHIDHLQPCKTFNLFDERQQKICFHYSNMRPLWSTTEIAMKYGEDKTYIENLNRKRDGSN